MACALLAPTRGATAGPAPIRPRPTCTIRIKAPWRDGAPPRLLAMELCQALPVWMADSPHHDRAGARGLDAAVRVLDGVLEGRRHGHDRRLSGALVQRRQGTG